MLLPYFDSFPEGRASILPKHPITVSEEQKTTIRDRYLQAEANINKKVKQTNSILPKAVPNTGIIDQGLINFSDS